MPGSSSTIRILGLTVLMVRGGEGYTERSGVLARETMARLYRIDPARITDFVEFDPAKGAAFFMRAEIGDVAADAVIVEVTGTEDKVEGMIELLRPIGIVEMVRTGQVSMTRGVNDGVRRVAGTNGNRYEDVMELAEMMPGMVIGVLKSAKGWANSPLVCTT